MVPNYNANNKYILQHSVYLNVKTLKAVSKLGAEC